MLIQWLGIQVQFRSEGMKAVRLAACGIEPSDVSSVFKDDVSDVLKKSICLSLVVQNPVLWVGPHHSIAALLIFRRIRARSPRDEPPEWRA